MTADQHYRNVTANGWRSLPGELIAYACNLCDHLVEIPKEAGPLAHRSVRQAALAKARASIRAHVREVHPHAR